MNFCTISYSIIEFEVSVVFEPGKILNNRYKLESIIAKGGMGAIYLATDTALSVSVAVKENLFSTEEYVRQFQREANILASLRHPHLPRVTEHFIIPGIGQYLVMDYIEGEDIRQRLRRSGALSEQEVIIIGVSVCETLEYLHSLNPPIVHRDIKPGNIKITPKGEIYLVDFGLAKLYVEGKVTTLGAQSLTPGYAPPEQYGKGTEPRTDIYALGATLYAALTNAIPEDSISRAMGTGQLTPIHTYNPNITPSFVETISKAMAVDIDDRYSNAKEFRTAIQRSDRSKLTLTQPINTLRIAPPPEKTQRGSRQKQIHGRKKGIFFGIIGGALIIAFAAYAFSSVDFAKRGTFRTEKTNFDTPIQETQIIQSSRITSSPTISITDSHLVTQEIILPGISSPTNTSLFDTAGQFAYASIIDGVSQIFLMGLDGTTNSQLTNLRNGACQPTWSQDGQRLIFVSPCSGEENLYPNSSLFLLDLKSSIITPLPTVPGGDFEPEWSPISDQIAFTSLRDGSRTHIYILDLELNTIPELLSPMVASDSSPAWSPDGSRIAFVSTRGGSKQIWLMRPNGKEPTEFTQFSDYPSNHPSWSPEGTTIIFSKGNDANAFLSTQEVSDDFLPEKELTKALTPLHEAEYTTDGNWILCESLGDIYLLESNGSNPVNLTNSPMFDFDPALRP